MDEILAFFDMIPAKNICKSGSKKCVVRTSGCENRENNLEATRSRRIRHQNATEGVDE